MIEVLKVALGVIFIYGYVVAVVLGSAWIIKIISNYDKQKKDEWED